MQDTEMKRGDESYANVPAPFLRRRVERPLLARRNRRLAHVAAVVAVLLHCACSLLVHTAAEKVMTKSLGSWSTAVLSEARYWLAATSLPNQGLAIFAGGQGTSCDCCCDDCGLRGMCGCVAGGGGGHTNR